MGRRVGSAVLRNRLRRRLRACVAARREQLRPGAYLITAAPAAAHATFAELDAAVAELLQAAGRP